MIIDAHLHLDEKIDGTAQEAAAELCRQLTDSQIARALVLHLEAQPWSAAEFSEAIRPYQQLRAFVNVHPHAVDAREQLRNAVENLGFIGLKLHPRLQKFDTDDAEAVRLVQFAGEMNIPVLIDAFPDGTHLMSGFSPLKYASLVKQSPNTRVIVAHMGGHHVLDMMMLAKRLPNMYFDISYSLLYYQGSSVPDSMVYAIRSMKNSRVFYGSDYPDRSIGKSLKMSLDYLRGKGFTDGEMELLLFGNAREFFGWYDL